MPYTVYVIRLKPEVLQEPGFRNQNPNYEEGKACLYVGQTWHPPKHRYQQHINGVRSCNYVEKYHWGIHKRLTGKNPTYETRAEAEAREAEYAKELREKGYAVWYG